jgi:ribonuclease R
VEFMQNTIGQQFKGIVSGLTEWGMYVEIEENKCEGMVRLSDLEDDFYELDAQNYRIIGRRNKRIISFGDEIWVEVKAANLNDRTIDLIFVDKEKEARHMEKESRHKEKESRHKEKEARHKEKESRIEAKSASRTRREPRVQDAREQAETQEPKKIEKNGRNIKDYYGFDD